MAILLVDNVAAQVQISGVDRGFQNGTTVTIDGLGFGTKAFPAPRLWDDLNSPAYDGFGHGDVFPTRDGDNDHPQDSNAPQKDAGYSESSLASVLDSGNARVDGRYVYAFRSNQGGAIKELGDVGGDFLMVDWWIYSDAIMSINPGTTKLGRFWAGSAGTAGRITIYPERIKWDAYPDESYGYGSWFVDGVWNHYRLLVDSSGGLGPNGGHGTIKFYWNNTLVASGSDLSWTVGVSGGPNYTWAETIQAWDYHNSSPHVGPTYVSDIYLDNSQARVVLGDASTWSQVQHYELQIPQDWQPQSIQVTGNLGSFTPGESVWLYVVDANGNLNENGLAVETDLGPPPEGPGQPGQPITSGS